MGCDVVSMLPLGIVVNHGWKKEEFYDEKTKSDSFILRWERLNGNAFDDVGEKRADPLNNLLRHGMGVSSDVRPH